MVHQRSETTSLCSNDLPHADTMQNISVSPVQKQELLSLCLALDSWRHARAALIKLRDDSIQADDALYEALTTAVAVLYMRPFERSHGLLPLKEFERFDSNNLGRLLKEIHDALDKTRNQILAHQQLTGWDKLLQHFRGAEPSGKLVVQLGPPFSYEVQTPTLNPDMVPQIFRLMEYQTGRVEERFFRELAKVLPTATQERDFTFVE